ncbi:MAG TPA: phage tail protein [Myxococcales bacterium]|jgi:phage tail-like protein|nr:phage tail protein [Myxococcales bacterium]
MAEQSIQTSALAPSLLGLPLGQARRMARRHADAKVEFRLVDSEEKALTVVRQHPEAGDELTSSRVIKLEIASRPWIQYLPGIYQDADEENADFLQRFLMISAHLTCGIEENLEFIHELFDPRITNAKWLPWLASWLAMPLLEGWDEEKRREIIQRTPELYRKRGTAEGLKLALRLFADVKAEIHEGEWPYPGMVIGRSSTVGKDTVLSPPVFISQCFTVELPDKKTEIPRERLRTVQALVETEKPAHAHYALVFEETEPTYEAVPFLHVGKTGRVGVDARIGGLEDVPEAHDEELQKLALGRKQG